MSQSSLADVLQQIVRSMKKCCDTKPEQCKVCKLNQVSLSNLMQVNAERLAAAEGVASSITLLDGKCICCHATWDDTQWQQEWHDDDCPLGLFKATEEK